MSLPLPTSIPGNKKKKGFKTNPEFLDPTFLLKKSFLQFVKNYSSKLLKTYGEHCPVVSQVSEKQVKSEKNSNPHIQGASQTLASPGPLARDPSLCQEGAAQVATELCFSAICSWEIFLCLFQGVSKCPMGGAALHTQSSGLSPVRQARKIYKFHNSCWILEHSRMSVISPCC